MDGYMWAEERKSLAYRFQRDHLAVSVPSDEMGLSGARNQRAPSPVCGCVCMKSRNSEMEAYNFSSGGGTSDPQTKDGESQDLSCGSGKSDESKEDTPKFSGGAVSSDRQHFTEATLQTFTLEESTGQLQQDPNHPDDVLPRVLERHKTSMKNKYKSLIEGMKILKNKTLQNWIDTHLYIAEEEANENRDVFESVKIETRPRKVQDTPISCNDIFKPLTGHGLQTCMKHKTRAEMTENAQKGKKQEKQAIGNVLSKCIDDVKKRVQLKVDKNIKQRERKPLERSREQEPRSVLTIGVAGAGKSTSVQKFVLDWAEGKANQDVDFVFVLPFRELNLIQNESCSLVRLLCVFHPELKRLDSAMYEMCKMIIIFDGLDESRIPLNILQCAEVSDVTMTSSVGELVSNLIKGELLPSACVWITSRPAAANQIPSEFIDRVTEIHGFSETQKEEYFRETVADRDQADEMISYIKATRSLYIMCDIPAFCCISASVLSRAVKQDGGSKLPKTLTEMYAHFLSAQMDVKNGEGEDEADPQSRLESNRQMLLKLGGLAFKQLMKGNVMFYEEELRESSIEVSEASVYSQICTEIFQEESLLYQRKLYYFVHLSFQEFLAAFYVFHCYISGNTQPLQGFGPMYTERSETVPLDLLLTRTVGIIVYRENVHLDLFSRFLLGVSLESNQRLLQGLLRQMLDSSDSIKKTIQDIVREIQSRHYCADISITVFLCMSEMNEQSLCVDIEKYVKSEKPSDEALSASHCSVIAYMLQISEKVLEEFDVKKYNISWRGYKRLVPAVFSCRKARLAGCSLTAYSCTTFKAALQSVDSPLIELDLSNNDLQDSGVKLLCAGLKSSHCKLETLRLSLCSLTEYSCELMIPVLQSANSRLKSLDLSNNDLLDSGVEMLSFGLQSLLCQLEILRLSGCMVTEKGCSYLASALSLNPSHLKELDLSYNHPGELGVCALSARLEDPRCKLETLVVEHAGKFRLKPGLRKYAVKLTLDPNTASESLSFSEWSNKAACAEGRKSYPDHPERFDLSAQVMCRESLTGRCYWETEWRSASVIAVTYKGISRKGDGDDCMFGMNEKSWCLIHSPGCFRDTLMVMHNKNATEVSIDCDHRVGVYLDWTAGTLSFYRLSAGLTHLHTFFCTFTEPLYAGFRLRYCGCAVRICQMK